jgi:hypothetical protein
MSKELLMEGDKGGEGMANLMFCLEGSSKTIKHSTSKPVSRMKYEPETSQKQGKGATHCPITFGVTYYTFGVTYYLLLVHASCFLLFLNLNINKKYLLSSQHSFCNLIE